MKKEKSEKVIRQKTKRFTLTAKGKLGPESSVEVRRRLSKEERKIQNRIDEENVLAVINFSALDEYKSTEMKVTLTESKTDLESGEWSEIVNFVLTNNAVSWGAAFILIDKNTLPANMLPAVKGFMEDSVKTGYHFYEIPVPSFFSVYWLLGLSIGTSIGSATGDRATWLCLGLGIGMCMGACLDAGAKKKRKDLKIARGMPVEKSEKKVENKKK